MYFLLFFLFIAVCLLTPSTDTCLLYAYFAPSPGTGRDTKGYVASCFEGVTDIKQRGQTWKLQKDVQGQL